MTKCASLPLTNTKEVTRVRARYGRCWCTPQLKTNVFNKIAKRKKNDRLELEWNKTAGVVL